MPPPLSPQETARRRAALEAALRGRPDRPDLACGRAAATVGMSTHSYRAWMRTANLDARSLLGELGVRPPDPPPEAPPQEAHDARFYRSRLHHAQREIERMARLIEDLGGIRRVPVSPPVWARETGGARRRSVAIAHTSDWHLGEVIRPGEVQGLNEFNVDICQRRLRRYFNAVCEIGARWESDTAPQGVILTLAGDLISGDLHEEHLRTNELTSHEQVRAAVETATAGIRLLLEAWPHVHVVAVPGNHGRTTKKPTAKLYGALSYDIMIASMVADRFSGEDRVTWQADGATDQFTPVLGRKVMTSHGDKMGTGGGHGFAGPVLPIIRGGHKIRLQQAEQVPPDLILVGHFHTSAAPPRILANGSVPGWSEFGRDIRAAIEPPQQWFALMTERWGLRERVEVQLEDPAAPSKPRVRIPARIVEA